MSSDHYCAFDHKAWDKAGLKEFGDFAECVEYVNQEEYGDGQLEGEWYYGDDEGPIEHGQPTWVIYSGSFGNYNSPGADSYTYAEVYDNYEEYKKELAKWESQDEYLESEDEEEEEEEEEDEGDDEPEDGDYTTEDHRRFYQYGKLVVSVPMKDEFEAEDWEPHVKEHMEKNGFYPNVWWISDHGNAHLLSIVKGTND